MPDEVPRTAGEMPKLDAFDQEFGSELPADAWENPRRRTVRVLAGVLLAAAIISVPALAWFYADGLPLRPTSMSQPGEQRSEAAAEVDRLTREVAALKQEIRELTAAQQQSAEVIASLQAAEQDARNPPAYWCSSPPCEFRRRAAGGCCRRGCRRGGPAGADRARSAAYARARHTTLARAATVAPFCRMRRPTSTASSTTTRF